MNAVGHIVCVGCFGTGQSRMVTWIGSTDTWVVSKPPDSLLDASFEQWRAAAASSGRKLDEGTRPAQDDWYVVAFRVEEKSHE